jgi:hypothetical protein
LKRSLNEDQFEVFLSKKAVRVVMYARSLDFDETPDYEKVREIL